MNEADKLIEDGNNYTRKLLQEIDELRIVCAEAYQVVGALSTLIPDDTHEGIIKALDNLSAAANGERTPHETMLPFVIEEKK